MQLINASGTDVEVTTAIQKAVAQLRTAKKECTAASVVLVSHTVTGATVAVFPVAVLPISLALLKSSFRLSKRQGQVVLLAAARRSDDEIAEILGIAPETARVHLNMGKTRLNVTRRKDIELRLQEFLMDRQ